MKEEISLTELGAPFQNPPAPVDKALFYKKLSRGALLMMAIFLLIQFTLIVIQDFNKGLQKKMEHWNAVAGVTNDENLFGVQTHRFKRKPAWTFKEMWTGEWQKKFEEWFNKKMIPFRSTLIKLHNQIYYTIFFKSYMYSSGIVIGKNRYLYEKLYMDKYYNVTHAVYTQEKFDKWANDLQTLANFFRQRGQHFIYVVTPSKASFQPEHLPACHRCDPTNTRPDYHGFVATLNKRGFKFINASESTFDVKKELAPFMFPKGGTHWTSLAGAFATRDIMKEMSVKYPLPELQFTYRLDQKPREIDMDLAGLLNLFARPRRYIVPEITIKPMRKKSQKPIKVAIVSGSFMFEVASVMAKTELFDQIDFFFYWKIDHYRNRADTKLKLDPVVGSVMPFESLGIKEDGPGAYDDILKADVVILEENETNMSSPHFRALSEKMLGKKITD